MIVVAIIALVLLNPESETPPADTAEAPPVEVQPEVEQTTAPSDEQLQLEAEKEQLQLEQARLAEEQEKLKQEQARLAEEEQQRQARLEQEALEKKRAQEADAKRQAELAAKKAAEEKQSNEVLAKKKSDEKKKQSDKASKKQKKKKKKNKTATVLDLSGTYIPDQGLEELVLVQKGQRIKGTIGTNGSTLEGLLDGNLIEFIFTYSRTGYNFKEGTGEFIVSDDGNRLVGSRFKGGFPERTPWNLTRSDAAKPVKKSVQPVAVAESGPDSGSSGINLTGTYEPDEGFEEVVLKQTGNKISGTIGTNGSTINGTLKGNTLSFVFNYSRTGYGFKDGYGKFKIKADGSRLIGTRSKAGFPKNSSWNLTRKSDTN